MDRGSHWMDISPDAAFAIWSEQRGAAEIELGKLAAQKGTAPVQAFGQIMIEDYTRFNQELQKLAADRFMTLPDDIKSDQSAAYRKLEKRSGPGFDRTYVQETIKDQKGAIKRFQNEADKGKDRRMANFASQSLPVLKAELVRLESLQVQISGSSSAR